jgi:Uma2 family endonuclease
VRVEVYRRGSPAVPEQLEGPQDPLRLASVGFTLPLSELCE